MALPYSDHDFEMVKKGLEQGKTVSAISASIGRGTDALNHKIKVWREEGRLPESKRGRRSRLVPIRLRLLILKHISMFT